MKQRYIKAVSKSRRIPVQAETIRPPDNFWDKIAQKLGWKTF